MWISVAVMYLTDQIAALFYTKWVHTLETQQGFAPPDHEEKHNLDSLLEMLQEVGNNDNGCTSLAASAARMWASFLDDNWTWEGRF